MRTDLLEPMPMVFPDNPFVLRVFASIVLSTPDVFPLEELTAKRTEDVKIAVVKS
jgi:hypothetical protein